MTATIVIASRSGVMAVVIRPFACSLSTHWAMLVRAVAVDVDEPLVTGVVGIDRFTRERGAQLRESGPAEVVAHDHAERVAHGPLGVFVNQPGDQRDVVLLPEV